MTRLKTVFSDVKAEILYDVLHDPDYRKVDVLDVPTVSFSERSTWHFSLLTVHIGATIPVLLSELAGQ